MTYAVATDGPPPHDERGAGVSDRFQRSKVPMLPTVLFADASEDYRSMARDALLEGRTDLAQAVEAIKINTRQLAKAQRTWLRRFRQIEWMDLTPASTVHAVADQLIARVSPESPFR